MSDADRAKKAIPLGELVVGYANAKSTDEAFLGLIKNIQTAFICPPIFIKKVHSNVISLLLPLLFSQFVVLKFFLMNFRCNNFVFNNKGNIWANIKNTIIVLVGFLDVVFIVYSAEHQKSLFANMFSFRGPLVHRISSPCLVRITIHKFFPILYVVIGKFWQLFGVNFD